MWFITFHGGEYPCTKPSSPGGSYTGNVNTIAGMLLSGSLPPMEELRGFIVAEKNLYIANAHKTQSQILQFQPASGGTYSTNPASIWATDGLAHPFDLAFDGAFIYASNQDLQKGANSLQVTKYDLSGKFEGVFIPNAASSAPGPNLQMLRGIAWDGSSTWYVADEQGSSGGNSGKKGTGAVYVYDANGNYKDAIAVPDPVHLAYCENCLFIGSGSGNTVYYYQPGSSKGAQPLLSNPSVQLNGASGLAIPGDGYIYVGSRKSFQVLRFTLTMLNTPTATGGEVFFDQLPDYPEFIASL